MVEYKCDCCQYTTNRKLNYDRHLSSDRHLKQVSNSTQQVETTIQQTEIKIEENPLEIRIKELEELIKTKNEIIEKQENEINHLKEELYSKTIPNDNTLFKAKLIPKIKQENVIMEVKEIIKKDIDQTPNLNIEEFFEKYIKKEGETKYTFLYPINNGIKKPVIKFEYLKKGCIYNLKKVIQELTLNGLKELPDGISFFQVINERLNKFKVKTKDTIITTKHDEKEVDKCLKLLMIKICDFLRGSITAFVYTFSKQIELIDSDDYEIVREARIKKQFGEVLTSKEDYFLKKDNKNFRITESFKEITGINFENFYNNWYNTEIMSQFTQLDEDAEFKHFKVLLARKAERIIEKETETEESNEENEENEETEEE
jgi:hypothetical protein